MFSWFRFGVLNYFCKNTWFFTVVSIGSAIIKLRYQRSFVEKDMGQTFIMTISIISRMM